MQPNTTVVNSSNVNLTGKEADDSSDSENENDVGRYIWIIGGILLLVVGTICNSLALAVLCRRKMRRQKASVYLLVVALTDLAVLYSGLLRQVILEAFHLDVRKHSEWSCRVHMTSVYFFLDFSAWVLALLSLERLLSVLWPMVIRHRCTRLASIVAMVIVGVLLFAVNSPFLFLVGDAKQTRGNYSITRSCLPLSKENLHFVSKVWPWIDMTVFAFVPLLIHIACNVLIVKGVSRSIRRSSRNVRSDRRPPVHSERNGVQSSDTLTENGSGCFRELSAPGPNREFRDTSQSNTRTIPGYDGIGGTIPDSSTGFQTTECSDTPQNSIFLIASGNSAAACRSSDTSTLRMNGIRAKPLGIAAPIQSDNFRTGQCSDEVPQPSKNGENCDCRSESPWTVSLGDGTFGSGNVLASPKRKTVSQSVSRVACTNNDSVVSINMRELSEITKNGEQTGGAKENEQTDVATDSEQTDVATDSEQTDVAKDSEQTDVSKDSEQTDVAKDSEQTDVSKDSEQTGVSKNREQTDVAKDSEQTDVAKVSERTNVSKNREQTDVAMDSEQTDVATDSEQTDVAKDSEQTDVAKDSEQTDVATDSEQTDVAKASEQTDVAKDSKQTELIQNSGQNTNDTKQTYPTEESEHTQHSTNNEDTTPIQRHQNSTEKKPRPKIVSFQTHPTMPAASTTDETPHSTITQNDLDRHHHHHPNNTDNSAASLASNNVTHTHSNRLASTEAGSSAPGNIRGRRGAIRRRSAEEEGGRGRGVEDRRMIVGMRRTLVAVSVVFCVTTFPISLFLTIRLIQDDQLHEELYAILSILMYSNNAANFILYCLTSCTFRAEMAAMGRELVTKCRSLRRRPCRSLPHGSSRSQGFWRSSVSRWRLQSLSSSRSSRSYSFTTTSTQQTFDSSLSSPVISSCSLSSSVTACRYSVTASRPST